MMQSPKHILKLSCLAALVLIAACVSPPEFRIEPLPAYESMFENQEGWTGADGVYSVALADQLILWLFGDTWVGAVRNNVHVNAVIVNNSIALQRGLPPSDSTVDFYFGRAPEGRPAALIQPADGRGWLWIYHGVHTSRGLYLFLVQVERTPEPPAASFKLIGTWLAHVGNPRDPPQNWRIDHYRIPWASFSSAGDTLFGSWVLRQAEWAYIYGTTEDVVDGFHHKYMILARAPVGGLTEFGRWQFFADGKWLSDFTEADRLCDGVANEFSVSFLPALGKYIVVYSDSHRSDGLLARLAPDPWGPWGDPMTIYRCPEAGRNPTVICYAAKGHPEISQGPDELIVTYVANSTDFDTMVNDAGLYRPQFIRVRVGD